MSPRGELNEPRSAGASQRHPQARPSAERVGGRWVGAAGANGAKPKQKGADRCSPCRRRAPAAGEAAAPPPAPPCCAAAVFARAMSGGARAAPGRGLAAPPGCAQRLGSGSSHRPASSTPRPHRHLRAAGILPRPRAASGAGDTPSGDRTQRRRWRSRRPRRAAGGARAGTGRRQGAGGAGPSL